MFFHVVAGSQRSSHAPQNLLSGLVYLWDDPIFANVTTFTTVTLNDGQSYTDKSSTTEAGEAAIRLDGNNTLTRCRVDNNECVRIAGPGTHTISHCWFQATGVDPAHADGIQCYGTSGTRSFIYVENTRMGVSGSSTAGFFCANNYIADFHFTNCVFHSTSGEGLRIHADVGGDQHIWLNNCYFVDGTGNYLLNYGGGEIIIEEWNNVYNATIVDGVLIPGSVHNPNIDG